MKLSSALLGLLLALSLPAAPANAAIVRWTLDNVTGSTESLSGHIDYNTTTDVVSAWDIQAIGNVTGHFFSSSAASGNYGQVSDGGYYFSYNVSPQVQLQLLLQSSAVDDSVFSGTSDITLASSSLIKRFQPGHSPVIALTGQLVYGGIIATPLPAALPLAVIGFSGAAYLSRRRRRSAAFSTAPVAPV